MKLAEVKSDNIHLVSADQVFCWVKTGAWSVRVFRDWQDAIREQAYTDGQNNMQEAMNG